jgi:hypothetical protein
MVRDHISTIYFDDILFDDVRNDTRSCNHLHTFCCGGRGEEVRLESRFCWDSCYRGRSIGTEQSGSLNCIFHCCVPCVPVVCPGCLCPCAATVSSCLPGLFFYYAVVEASLLFCKREFVVNHHRLGIWNYPNRKQFTSRMQKQL